MEKMGILWDKFLLSNILISMCDYLGASVRGTLLEPKKKHYKSGEITNSSWDYEVMRECFLPWCFLK